MCELHVHMYILYMHVDRGNFDRVNYIMYVHLQYYCSSKLSMHTILSHYYNLYFHVMHVDVLFGFLAYQYPCHIALSIRSDLDQYCSTVDVLLEAAKCVHQLVSLLPSHVVTQLEQEELLWERKGELYMYMHVASCM